MVARPSPGFVCFFCFFPNMLDLSFYDIKGSVLSVVSVIDGADDRLSCPNKYLLSKIDIVFYRCLKLIGIDSV